MHLQIEETEASVIIRFNPGRIGKFDDDHLWQPWYFALISKYETDPRPFCMFQAGEDGKMAVITDDSVRLYRKDT